MQAQKTRTDLTMDLALLAFLIVLDLVARLLPHVPGVWPVAATALFAGRTLRLPLLAFVIPFAATALSNVFLPAEDGRILLVIAFALCAPALLGMVARRWRGALPTVAAMIASSLIFFITTNFAVWAFDDLYPRTLQGLAQCYIAALPFLDRTVFGDLAWCGVLFGGAWLVQRGPALMWRAH